MTEYTAIIFFADGNKTKYRKISGTAVGLKRFEDFLKTKTKKQKISHANLYYKLPKILSGKFAKRIKVS